MYVCVNISIKYKESYYTNLTLLMGRTRCNNSKMEWFIKKLVPILSTDECEWRMFWQLAYSFIAMLYSTKWVHYLIRE